MKAHDVRELKICPSCRQLGDGRQMLVIRAGLLSPGHYHGGCLALLLTRDELLNLPTSELKKFTLAELGPECARAVIAVFDARIEQEASAESS